MLLNHHAFYMAFPPTNGLHLRHRIHELTPIHIQRDHVVRRAFLKHFEVDHHFDKVFVYFFLSFRKYNRIERFALAERISNIIGSALENLNHAALRCSRRFQLAVNGNPLFIPGPARAELGHGKFN